MKGAKANPRRPGAPTERTLAVRVARRRAELVDIAQVREMAARTAGIISRGFERIGPRIGPVWSVEQDPLKREQLLEDELRKVLHEWTDEIERLIGGADG